MHGDYWMLRKLHELMKDNSAATAVEYGLLVGVFAIGMTFGARSLTNQLYNLWHSVENNSSKALTSHN